MAEASDTTDVSISQQTYDAEYYATSCGSLTYSRDEPHWHRFFGDVAKRIVASVNPRTVMDAGCAIGFLVESLRDLGVEAYGFDYSEFAISQVPDAYAPYVRTGDLTQPIEGRYDLVTCIEVVEHLRASDAPLAIKHLAAATDTILFSSTFTDFTERTHLNVQPPNYWARLFAAEGFVRDMYTDVTFLAPWAVLYRRSSTDPADLVERFEREVSWLVSERDALRQEVVAQPLNAQPALAVAEAANSDLSTQVTSLSSRNAELSVEVGRLEAELGASRQEVLLAVDNAIDSERDAGHARAELEGLRVRLASAEHQLSLIAGIGAELQALKDQQSNPITDGVSSVVKKLRRGEK